MNFGVSNDYFSTILISEAGDIVIGGLDKQIKIFSKEDMTLKKEIQTKKNVWCGISHK